MQHTKREEARLILGFIGLIWLVFLVDVVLPIDLASFGLTPRKVFGSIGIVTMPFLHGGWNHIISNTVPLCVLLFLLAGMYRVFRGPSDADRMMAAQLFGTTAVAVLLVTSFATGWPALMDAALVMALLAAVTAIAFVRGETSGGSNDDS